MSQALIREVAAYCWSNKFLDIFTNFFRDHASAFEDAPEICSGEHNLVYYDLFEKYLKIYEDTLTGYVKSLDCSIEEFYREIKEAKDDGSDPYLSTFIDCLLASADYDSFYKVMAREGRKLKNKKRAAVVAADYPVVLEHKADSKGADSYEISAVESKDYDYDFKADHKDHK